MKTPTKPSKIEKTNLKPIFSEIIIEAKIAVKIGNRYCITVASKSVNRWIDSYTKKKGKCPEKTTHN